jgi:hypothetical protein
MWVKVVGFCQAIALQQASPRQPLEGLVRLHRQGSATAHERSDRIEAIGAQISHAADRGQHGWQSGEKGRLMSPNHLEQLVDVKARQQQHGGADGNGQIHGGRHAIAVQQRQRRDKSFFAILQIVQPMPGLQGVGHQIAVGEDRRLGTGWLRRW